MTTARSTKVLILTLGNGLNVLINFLTLPYLVRSLSYVEYGSYGQVLLLVGIIQGIFSFNLNQVANIFFSDERYRAPDVFATLTRLTILLGIGGMLFMYLLSPVFVYLFDNRLLDRLVFLSLLNLFAQIPIPIFMAVLVYWGKVKSMTMILVLSNIVKVIAMLIAIQLYHSLDLLMMALSVVSILQMVAFYLSIPATIRRNGGFQSDMSRRFFKLASPLAISSLIERSLFYIDGMVISSLLGTTAFALYRAGAIEVPFIATLYGAVATIVMPEVARSFAERNYSEIIRLKRVAISTTVFMVYPVLLFLLFFSGPLVSAYLSQKYVESVLVFSIFNLSLFIRVNDFQDVIIVSGNGRYIFFSVAFTTVLNLLLNYILISGFGIAGGAASFIISLFVFAGLLTRKSLQIMKCRFVDLVDIKLIGKILLVSAALACALFLIYTFLLPYLAFIIIVAPLYAATVFLIGVKWKLADERLLNFVLMKVKTLLRFKVWA
ncbi:MAG: oligosaccharide flippase family protein [Bacteroidia bacterium]